MTETLITTPRAFAKAIESQNTDLVRRLLDAGADPNLVGEINRTPLLVAAYRGNADTVRLLLDSGAKIVPGDANYLHLAVHSGDPEIVQVFLAAGCDPRWQRERGGHALHEASHVETGDQLAIATLLLNAGASPNLPIDHGTTPLHLAASRGNAPMVGLHLECGGDPASVDSLGMTVLHYAVQYAGWGMRGDFGAVVSQLLDAGADPNAVCDPKKENKGATPLILAAGAPLTLLKQLVDAGADVNTADAAKRTPLGEALTNVENFAYLLSVGANIETLAKASGKPALLTATEHANVVAINALLEAGSDPNTAYRGRLPLCVAASRMYPLRDVIAALLEGGANPLLPDKTGATAVDVAHERKTDWLLSLLDAARLVKG
ncbi:MAG: ankyrin repeat domain-containing protein [Armatimonadetes bacterium]|nr:ankyrin repeat domain-containing protein [Armatimonadota bacterium]